RSDGELAARIQPLDRFGQHVRGGMSHRFHPVVRDIATVVAHGEPPEHDEPPPSWDEGACSRFHPSSLCKERAFAPLPGRYRGWLLDFQTTEAVRRQAHRWFSSAPCRGPSTITRSLKDGRPGYSSGSEPLIGYTYLADTTTWGLRAHERRSSAG